MPNHFQNFHEILSQAQAVRDSGGKLGKDFDRLEQTYHAITAPQENPGQRLARAIIEGADAAELDRAWLGVLVGQAVGKEAARMGATQEVMRYLAPALQAELTRHAPENYAAARKGYNAAAKALTEALAAVDADAAPETLVESPDLMRTWGRIPALVTELEGALSVLMRAAAVAGIATTPENVIALALSVPEGVKRRPVWEAWEAHDAAGRAGRWGILVGLGVTLGAPSLEGHASYRKPAPLEVEYRRSGIGHAPYVVDPEDALEGPAAAAPVKAAPAAGRPKKAPITIR